MRVKIKTKEGIKQIYHIQPGNLDYIKSKYPGCIVIDEFNT